MKLINLTTILILSLCIFKPNDSISQKKLPSGLYELDNSGDYTLKLDGKSYHTDGKLIAALKNIKITGITSNRFTKNVYDLNIKLGAEAVKKTKEGPDYFNRPNYMGIVLKGALVLAVNWYGPINADTCSISSKSKLQLEQIAIRMKAEQGKP